MARRLRIEPYDPDAVDGDGDGVVQENTAWERPVGTRLIDEFGTEIRRGFMSTQRPPRMRVVDRDGNDVRYTPSYAVARERPVTQTPLGSIGAPSLAESGARPMPTLADQGLLTIGETGRNIDSIVNPQTVVGEDAPELPLPLPSMVKSTDAPSSIVDIAETQSGLLYGGLTHLVASEDEWVYAALEADWTAVSSGYFEFLTGSTLSFGEFHRLVIDAESGVTMRPLVDDEGNPIPPERLMAALSSVSAAQVERGYGVREAMKAKVARDVADHMTREDLKPDVLDEVSREMFHIIEGNTRSKRVGIALSADVSRYGLPVRTFPDGTVSLSVSQRRELFRWAVGGERPLWLDSPDTPEEFKIIYGAGVIVIKPTDYTWDARPVMIPLASLPVYPSDDPDMVNAKQQYVSLVRRRESWDSTIEASNVARVKEAFDELVSHSNGRLHAYAKTTVAGDIEKRMINFIVTSGVADDDVGRFLDIGQILDSRDTGGNPYRFTTAEQRIAVLAASGLLKQEELEHLKQLVGWDFTKQENWDRFAEQIRVASLSNARAEIAENIVPAFPQDNPRYRSLQIVRISDAANYRDASNEVLSMDRSPLGLRVSSLIKALEYLESDDAKTAVGRLRALEGKGEPTSHDELVASVREAFDIAEAALPQGFDDSTFIEFGHIIDNAAKFSTPGLDGQPDKLGGPTAVELALDRPAIFLMGSIASDYVQQWAMTSNGGDPRSYALQEVAQELFGLDPLSTIQMEDIYSSRTDTSRTPVEEMRRLIDEQLALYGPTMRLFMRSQYANTQEFFRRMDIQSITLARSMMLPKDHPYILELVRLRKEAEAQFGEVSRTDLPALSLEAMVAMRPLSAFGSYLPAMKSFARPWEEGSVTLFSRVPVSRIVGTPFTGVGCLKEFEAVVIGDMLPATMVSASVLDDKKIYDPIEQL